MSPRRPGSNLNEMINADRWTGLFFLGFSLVLFEPSPGHPGAEPDSSYLPRESGTRRVLGELGRHPDGVPRHARFCVAAQLAGIRQHRLSLHLVFTPCD